MKDNDRFVSCLLGEPVDRAPYWVFWGPWSTTWHRWESEGMPCRNMDDYRQFFGSDLLPESVPVNLGPCPTFEREVLEETGDYRIVKD